MDQWVKVNKLIDPWLKKMVHWQNSSLNVLIDQFSCKEDLTHFLQDLYTSMDQVECIEDILTRCPSVGQFLGRVMTLSVLMMDTGFYESVMKCVFLFYKDHPKTSVETKAKSWVLSQVRYTCCDTKRTKALQRVLDVTGASLREFTSLHLDQASGCNAAYFLTRTAQIHKEKEATHGKREKYRTALQLIQIYIHFRHIPKFADLLDVLMKYVMQQESLDEELEKERENMLQELLKLSDKVYKCEKMTLPYKSQVILWRSYLPSLETDVLNMVHRCTDDLFDLSKQKDSVCKGSATEHLVRACAENVDIYNKVFSLLDHLHSKSKAQLLVYIKYWFHESINRFIGLSNNNQNGDVSVLKLFPRDVQAFVQLLVINPVGLPQNCCEYQIKQVAALKASKKVDKCSYVSLQHKFLSWQYTSLVVCLIGSREIVEPGLCMLHLFYLWPSHIQDWVKDFVIVLRGLLGKTTLSTTELSYINISTVGSSPLFTYVCGQFWMMLLLFCEASSTVWKEILQIVLPNVSSNSEYVKCVTESLELLWFLPSWITNKVKWKSLFSILASIDQDIALSGVSVEEEDFRKRCISKSRLLLKQFHPCRDTFLDQNMDC